MLLRHFSQNRAAIAAVSSTAGAVADEGSEIVRSLTKRPRRNGANGALAASTTVRRRGDYARILWMRSTVSPASLKTISAMNAAVRPPTRSRSQVSVDLDKGEIGLVAVHHRRARDRYWPLLDKA